MPKVTTFLSHSKGPGRIADRRAPLPVPGHGLGGGEKVDGVHRTDTGPVQVDKLGRGSPGARGRTRARHHLDGQREADPAVTLATQARKS